MSTTGISVAATFAGSVRRILWRGAGTSGKLARMIRRVSFVCVVASLGVAAVSGVALAGVTIGPSAPTSEVGAYVDPSGGGGANDPSGNDPSGGGGANENNPGSGIVPESGAGGQLPFTGLVLLPLVMVGVTLIFGAVALRRHAGNSTVPA